MEGDSLGESTTRKSILIFVWSAGRALWWSKKYEFCTVLYSDWFKLVKQKQVTKASSISTLKHKNIFLLMQISFILNIQIWVPIGKIPILATTNQVHLSNCKISFSFISHNFLIQVKEKILTMATIKMCFIPKIEEGKLCNS